MGGYAGGSCPGGKLPRGQRHRRQLRAAGSRRATDLRAGTRSRGVRAGHTPRRRVLRRMGFSWARATSLTEPVIEVGIDHSPSYLWNSARAQPPSPRAMTQSVSGSGFRQERGDHGLGCGELSGASRNRTCEARVRGHARSVVAVGCRSRTAFTGGLAPESQPAVAVCDHRNDGIRDERR
jgi:hypothetical protein